KLAAVSIAILLHTTATSGLSSLSLHDALPISLSAKEFALLELFVLNQGRVLDRGTITAHVWDDNHDPFANLLEVLVGRLANGSRSEEHTSELQSHLNIVCRLLLVKKNGSRSYH